jgi:hypothetical protein
MIMSSVLQKIIKAWILCLPFTAIGQNYWQQEVNYKIEVTLDDVKHEITAFEEFEYINNSPDKLDFLYLHLWPNAYKNGKTALAKQQWRDGEKLLKYGHDSIKGGIEGLDFKVNGQTVSMEYDVKFVDICKLMLPFPLESGGRIFVSTPFKVKIPSGEISRLGHIGQSYQITQWYPKPAVYDQNGWNQMPYLNQGEFYSEYGSFDVKISVPKNYIIGATGDLLTQSEILFLNEKAASTARKFKNNELSGSEKRRNDPFPVSDSEMKTLHYKQSLVHDFAWFADKRYEVLKGEVELPESKRKVSTWAMFTPKNARIWENAIEYLNDGTYYYSLWNGDYPYSHVTAVDGTISAGGGMEYPNVTVIGNSSSKEELEVVIVHEVGHNWFYGILGSNERVHGWMDEGMNTLNEVRYIQTKYPLNTRMSDMVLNGKFHFNDLDHHDTGDITYRFLAMIGEDQPIETSSEDFTSINYDAIMYQKTGLVFFYLKAYLGEEMFGKCMHAYFDQWKFKHPQPEDMQSVLEKVSGKDLSWLFKELIQTTDHIDFKLKRVKKVENGYDVRVKNVGQVPGPIEISAFLSDSIIETVWVESGKGSQVAHLTSREVDEVRIDANSNIPELNRTNNNWKRDLLFNKVEPLRLELLVGDHEPTSSTIFWTPLVAGNVYDKLMLGLTAHNYGVPFNKFQFLLAPLYSLGRKTVSGIGELSYSILPRNSFKLVRVGASLKSFGNDDNPLYKTRDQYFANVSPYVYMNLGNRKAASPFSHSVLMQGIFSLIAGPSPINEAGGFVKYGAKYFVPDHQVEINLRNDYLDNLDNENVLGRISVEGIYRFRYLKNKMNRWVEWRTYFGSNYLYTENDLGYSPSRYSLSMSGVSGLQDLFYEDYYFGRSNSGGLFGHQRNDDVGGFKTASSFGNTSFWMATGNLYIQLPIKSGIFGAFVDGGIFSKNGINNTYAFDTGVAIRITKVFGVYFPLYQSANMGNLYVDYVQNIRFSLKLNVVNKSVKIPGFN